MKVAMKLVAVLASFGVCAGASLDVSDKARSADRLDTTSREMLVLERDARELAAVHLRVVARLRGSGATSFPSTLPSVYRLFPRESEWIESRLPSSRVRKMFGIALHEENGEQVWMICEAEGGERLLVLGNGEVVLATTVVRLLGGSERDASTKGVVVDPAR